jgi:hypothetical protein
MKEFYSSLERGDCSGVGGRGSKRGYPKIAGGLGMVVPGKGWHSCLQAHLPGDRARLNAREGSGALSAGQAWKIVMPRVLGRAELGESSVTRRCSGQSRSLFNSSYGIHSHIHKIILIVESRWMTRIYVPSTRSKTS